MVLTGLTQVQSGHLGCVTAGARPRFYRTSIGGIIARLKLAIVMYVKVREKCAIRHICPTAFETSIINIIISTQWIVTARPNAKMPFSVKLVNRRTSIIAHCGIEGG